MWLRRSLILSLAAVLTAVACGTSSTQAAGSVKVMAQWTGAEQASFMAVMAPFTQQTGITISYEASRDQDALLTTRVASGNPPDLAAAPSPTLLTNFAKTGKVIALNSVVDMNALAANYSKSWIDLGEPLNDGKLYEMYSWVSLKGLIWYDPKNFQTKSYNVPKSWDDLINLQNTIKSGGTTPWCIALESGAASGWPGSDWVKEIVLSQSGPTVYDAWWQGKQKWTSPEIKQAWQTWGTILGPNDGNVYGGAKNMGATNFADGGTPMFQNPPKCYMHNQASFITSFFQSANAALQPVTDFNFFPMPDITASFSGAHVVAGDAWSMFHDTPQARKMLQYLTTADAQAIWVKRGGKISPNKNVSTDVYPDKLAQSTASILVATKIAKYDAGDLMPADMKNAYWAAVLQFAQDQSKLNSILANLDTIQAKAYTA
ncbi:MAG TPA: ABC transporter substrate-binding protein [Candidatus Dormibacteraeota bacterium]|nr:ABC transporter substrate-binding protein [Candidatus Dormibacteraeota bacterium]